MSETDTTDTPVIEALTIRNDELLRQIASLSDVPVLVSIEVGRTEIRVRDLLEMKAGTIFEVRKIAGEPLDVRLNGRALARGEVVAIEQTAAVRIVDIAKPGALT